MKLTEDGSDVFTGGGVSKQLGSKVLDILQFLTNSGGEAIQNAIAIVESFISIYSLCVFIVVKNLDENRSVILEVPFVECNTHRSYVPLTVRGRSASLV